MMVRHTKRSRLAVAVALVCLGIMACVGCGGDAQPESTAPEGVAQATPPPAPPTTRQPTGYAADPNAFKAGGTSAGFQPLGSGQGQSGGAPTQPDPNMMAGAGSSPSPDPTDSRTADNRPGVGMRDRLPADGAPAKPDLAAGAMPVAGFEVGDLAPEIEGADVTGAEFRLSDYRGKVVVLDFWGDW